MKRGLGRNETALFAYIQMRRLTLIRTGELVQPLRLSAAQERKLLSRLSNAGLIARVWRGLYLVPPRIPLGAKWSPGEAQALNALMEEKKGRYQICGPNAFNRYGYDEQIPTRVYAYNNRLSGERMIGSVSLLLIKVADARLGDTEAFESADGQTAVYSSRIRTLVDAIYDWSRFDSLPRGYNWIKADLAAGRIEPYDLVRVTLRYGDTGTTRRIGALLEREGVSGSLLKKVNRALKPTAGLIPWIPTRPKRGTVNRRWGILFNEHL
jgi:predicted transcriptional regulator of viral defense system